MVRENSEDFNLRASMVDLWGSSPQCPRIKKSKDGKNAKRKKL